MLVVEKLKHFTEGQRQFRQIRSILKQSGIDRIVYVDLGAAGGLEYRWRLAITRGLIKAYLVDPSDEWGNNRMSAFRLPNVTRVPYAFGGFDGPSTFFETVMPGCSSCLKPDKQALARFPVRDWFRVAKETTVQLRRAETVWHEKGYEQPDIIKIDIQGLEIPSLEGFGSVLDGVACIEAEARLIPIYQQEQTLYDMQRFMHDHGFVLRHLAPQGPFEGEYVEVNSYWMRPAGKATPRQKAITAAWTHLSRIPRPRLFAAG